MLLRAVALLVAGLTLTTGNGVLARDCPAADGRDTAAVNGSVTTGDAFHAPVGPGWRLALDPADGGWRLTLSDAEGNDLSWATPPLHGPNPRDIVGWHFRNSDNTGPNTGEVNAPQQLRLFVFYPDGRMAEAERKTRPNAPAEPPGRGALEITAMEIAGTGAGETPRLAAISFEVCMSWPTGAAPEIGSDIPGELVEQMGACGLDFPLRVSGHAGPVSLSGDIDGDGSFDIVAPIINEDSGGFGFAVCRAGTWLDILGAGSGDPVGDMTPADFEAMSDWLVYPQSEIGSATVAALGLVGDSIFLMKDVGPHILIYWSGDGYAIERQ